MIRGTVFALVAFASGGFVHFDIYRDAENPLQKRLADSLSRRAAGEPEGAPGSIFAKRSDDTDEVEVENQQSYYSMDILLGTPGQNISVLVDTGSSDLWVMSPDNSYCSSGLADGVSCSQDMEFDSSKSSTFSSNQTGFEIQYGDGSFAEGNYAQDVLVIGDVNISNANFALANETNSTNVVFGIGLPGSEATVDTVDLSGEYSPTYSNIPMQMKEQGYIDVISYSLWLNRYSQSTGSLLFGGVDHSKYNGSLLTVPIISSYSQVKTPYRLQVRLDGIDYYDSKGDSSSILGSSLSALLDSGTTAMMLPSQLVESIMDAIGAQLDSSQQVYIADCDSSGSFTFDFSGALIEVRVEDLLINIGSVGSQNYCYVAIYPSVDSTILGDSFLRSAYVVFDLENYEVGLANASRSDTGSENIDPITSGIPSATQAPRYSSSGVESTGTPVVGGGTVVGGGQGGDPTASLSSLLFGSGAQASTMASTSSSSSDAGNFAGRPSLVLTLASCILFLI